MQFISPALFALGALFLFMGIAMSGWAWVQLDRKVRQMLLRTTPTVIAQCRGGARCMVAGRVSRGSEPMLTAPLTGAPAVLFRAAALRRRNDKVIPEQLHREGAETAFWIRDGSGAALVRASSFRLVLQTSFSTAQQAVPPHLHDWLRSRIGYTTGGVTFEEKRVEEGQAVVAVGTVLHERDAAGAPVVVIGDRDAPLFVTNLPIEQAVETLHSNLAVGLGMLGFSMLVLAAGAVFAFVVG